MIRFEKDNKITYFKDAEAAAEWLETKWDEGDEEFGQILEDEYTPFAFWVNDNWTAMDILMDNDFNYEDLHNEWLAELAYQIYHNGIEGFVNEGGDEEDCGNDN